MLRYRLYCAHDGQPVDALEAHVLARAYRAAWRLLRSSEPVHRHQIASLDLVIDFGCGIRSPELPRQDARPAAGAPDQPPASTMAAEKGKER